MFTLKFFRWASVALLTFLTDIICFVVVNKISGSILISNTISFSFASFVNFCFHYFWTFKSILAPSKSMLRYFAWIVVSIIMSSALIEFIDSISIAVSQAKVLSSLILLPLNYTVGRKFIFVST